jgi:hypothetical protein
MEIELSSRPGSTMMLLGLSWMLAIGSISLKKPERMMWRSTMMLVARRSLESTLLQKNRTLEDSAKKLVSRKNIEDNLILGPSSTTATQYFSHW